MIYEEQESRRFQGGSQIRSRVVSVQNGVIAGNPSSQRKSHSHEVQNKEQARPLETLLRNQPLIFIKVLLACASVSFTVFFAYNSSLEIPVTERLIWTKPQNTILTINILSQVTLVLLSDLIMNSFECIRWAMICSKSGIPILTFLSLSSSTSLVGVLKIIFEGFRTRCGCKIIPASPRVWGYQRWHWFDETG